MASDEHRSRSARAAVLKTRADILWAAGGLGIMAWGLTFFLGLWVLSKTVTSGFAMAGIAVVVAAGVALVGAYLATRGRGGLRMLLARAPTTI